jgi:hypothetical protein
MTMRLWTVHPQYLDRQGLLAVWREALLAQAVLRGRTRGYRRHPQLERFRSRRAPVGCVADYLRAILTEAVRRGYHFDGRKISAARGRVRILATAGQLRYEWAHLNRKLKVRDRARWAKFRKIHNPEPHPLFDIVPGAVESFEKL